MSDATDRLADLALLEENWDGEGGIPPSVATLRKVAVVVELLAPVLEELGLPGFESASPLPDGGVDLEWDQKTGAEILMEIRVIE